MQKKVLIIGAGIAGLSAGSYLERNGYGTEIFEAHKLAGGLCTAWKRGDYIFDYCIHWLMGTKIGTDLNIIWNELGAFENETGSSTIICNFPEFTRIELSDGDTICFFADVHKFEKELLRISPEDEKKITRFIKDLKILSKLQPRAIKENWGFRRSLIFLIKNGISLLKLIKYMRMPINKFADQWKSPKLQEAFGTIVPHSWSSISLLLGLSQQHVQSAGYPIGGSLRFVRNIEKVYLKLGGKINYSCKVEKILIEDNKAIGISLENKKEYFGDFIISAADGYTTLYKMLEGKYLSKRIKTAYKSFSLFPSTVHIGFGVAKDLSDLPHSITLSLTEPLVLPDNSNHQIISVSVYNYDNTLAPEGKTPVTALLYTWNDQYWIDLAKNEPETYKKVKADIALRVLEILDNRFPGFASSVEQTDVSTPHTVKRYTGNRRGSFEGFAPTPKALMTKLPKKVPGLKNCYMIGQWTVPGGGLPTAAIDGRNITHSLCKRDKKQFISSVD